jgi:uncharacterized membrane protein
MKFFIFFILSLVLIAGDINNSIDSNISLNTNIAGDSIIQLATYPKQIQYHPIISHFALVLPFVVFLLTIWFFVFTKSLKILDFVLLVISSVCIYLSYIYGIDSFEIVKKYYLTTQVKDMITHHKNIGLIILGIVSLLLIMRVFIFIYKPFKLIRWYLFISLVLVVVIIYEGYLGTSLVYDKGVGVYYDALSSVYNQYYMFVS